MNHKDHINRTSLCCEEMPFADLSMQNEMDDIIFYLRQNMAKYAKYAYLGAYLGRPKMFKVGCP